MSCILASQMCESAQPFQASNVVDDSPDLERCTNLDFGVQFLCRKDWKMQVNEKELFVIISSEPTVSFVLEKIDRKIFLLGQLTKHILQEMGRYSGGFNTESVQMAGKAAVKVKAFSDKYPEIRLTDYYVIHNFGLYRVSFTVYPKAKWDDYQYLLKKIADSIIFLER
ncbi:MAG TPA: hypothetical protein DD723_00410 [Candidatus Omnitrophica bacterium]|nr:hypothetical protein [Candidatus Omnitrophota bacterium]